jgi:hypothetical protein
MISSEELAWLWQRQQAPKNEIGLTLYTIGCIYGSTALMEAES